MAAHRSVTVPFFHWYPRMVDQGQGEILMSMMAIKSNACGFNNISLKFLKLVYPFINFIYYMFLMPSLLRSIFPISWKKSLVVPVPKVSNPFSASDYRPISSTLQTHLLSKMFEVLVRSQMMGAISSMDCGLHDNQSGFWSGHSTVTAVINTSEIIRDNIEHNRVNILLFLDFKIAFDSVDIAVLCKKLKIHFKFSGTACNSIFSYLNNCIAWRWIESQYFSALSFV